jgi:hypothetical protein
VSGLGDEAFLAQGKEPSYRFLTVRKGAVAFWLSATRYDDGEPDISEMKAVATRVARQL